MSAGHKWRVFFQHWDAKRAPLVTALVILIGVGAIGGGGWYLWNLIAG